jgi:hypothetical protein
MTNQHADLPFGVTGTTPPSLSSRRPESTSNGPNRAQIMDLRNFP